MRLTVESNIIVDPTTYILSLKSFAISLIRVAAPINDGSLNLILNASYMLKLRFLLILFVYLNFKIPI